MKKCPYCSLEVADTRWLQHNRCPCCGFSLAETASDLCATAETSEEMPLTELSTNAVTLVPPNLANTESYADVSLGDAFQKIADTYKGIDTKDYNTRWALVLLGLALLLFFVLFPLLVCRLGG